MVNQKKKTRVIMIRHTNTGFHGVYFLGSKDVPITGDGIKHAKEIAQKLKGMEIDAIYSSCLKRSIMTAEEIAKVHGLRVEHIPEFNEMGFGVMEGMTGKEVDKRYPGMIAKRNSDKWNFRPPGGENYVDAGKRAIPVFRKLFEEHEGETVVIVIHSILMRIIYKEITGEDLFEKGGYIGFGCRMYFEKEGDGEIRFVKMENDRKYEGVR